MKKSHSLWLILLFISVTTTFSSCNKYPDGPKFTLLTKKERMQGLWDLTETNHSDGTVTYDNWNDIMELTEENEYIYTSGNISVSGEWEFVSDKEKVLFKIGNLNSTYKILRLKSKELWLQNESNGDVLKYKNKDKD